MQQWDLKPLKQSTYKFLHICHMKAQWEDTALVFRLSSSRIPIGGSYSTDQSSSSEANSIKAGIVIHCLLRNPKVHYHGHKVT
jgi:hypothetical protein